MGTEKFVKITWTPPGNFDVSVRMKFRFGIRISNAFLQPNEACRAAINVTTKGDVTRTWRVILIGYVDLISSSDKRSSRTTKNRRTNTTGTRSHASVTGTSQHLTTQVSTQEDNTNNTLTS